MPEVSEEGEQVLKSKVSRPAGVHVAGLRAVLPYSDGVTPATGSFAGPAVLCSRGGRPACIVPMYILSILFQH